MFTSPIFLIAIVFMAISFFISQRLKSKFKKYSKQQLQRNLSGKDIAEMMLAHHGINDVEVISVGGQLTDHYNPVKKTVNLSQDVYHGRNAAAAAVAAHECGHAVQHATAYAPLQLRSALVPIQNASTRVINFIFMASIFGGFFLFSSFPIDLVLYLIIGAYGVMTLFSVITLPVEFDASNRALLWMSDKGIVNNDELRQSKDALTWAALTYVVAALGSLVTLLYYVSMLTGRD